MTGGELLALAERVEGLRWPDREVDRAIEIAVMPERVSPCPTIELLAYTASLDAAMTLVPEGARFIIDSDGCHCRVTKPDDTAFPWNGCAALAVTMPLALTAAALRALATPINTVEEGES